MRLLLYSLQLVIIPILSLMATPANDLCTTAIEIQVGGACQLYDNFQSTPSQNPTPGVICFGNTTLANDVWFKAEVPASGNLTIDMIEIGFYVAFTMEAFEGTCNNLNRLSCNSIGERFPNYDSYPRIELEMRTPGEIIFIRIVGEDNSHVGNFLLCGIDQGYTKPCSIDFIETGTQSSCDPNTNTFSQDLVVHYRSSSTLDTLLVLGEKFIVTGSPQLVTINSIPANGESRNIQSYILSVSGDPNCDLNSIHFAADAFMAPQNCFNGTVVNDECTNAIPLTVGVECNAASYNNIGSTDSAISGCPFGQGQDVWFSIQMPQSGDVIINLNDVDFNLKFCVFKDACGNLENISSGSASSVRIRNNMPGEILYISVDGGQGNFEICTFLVEDFTNDMCVDAIDIPVTSECNSLIYSNHFASGTLPIVPISCDPGTTPFETWYTVVIPSTGHIDIEFENVQLQLASLSVDIYEGSCSNRNLLDCQSNIGLVSEPLPVFSITGRSPNEVLYIRVAVRYNGFPSYAYGICAVSDCPINETINYPINYTIDFEDSNSISGTDVINSGGNVQFDAGVFVLLDSGFEVKAQAVFHAFIDGCGGI